MTRPRLPVCMDSGGGCFFSKNSCQKCSYSPAKSLSQRVKYQLFSFRLPFASPAAPDQADLSAASPIHLPSIPRPQSHWWGAAAVLPGAAATPIVSILVPLGRRGAKIVALNEVGHNRPPVRSTAPRLLLHGARRNVYVCAARELLCCGR